MKRAGLGGQRARKQERRNSRDSRQAFWVVSVAQLGLTTGAPHGCSLHVGGPSGSIWSCSLAQTLCYGWEEAPVK